MEKKRDNDSEKLGRGAASDVDVDVEDGEGGTSSVKEAMERGETEPEYLSNLRGGEG